MSSNDNARVLTLTPAAATATLRRRRELGSGEVKGQNIVNLNIEKLYHKRTDCVTEDFYSQMNRSLIGSIFFFAAIGLMLLKITRIYLKSRI